MSQQPGDPLLDGDLVIRREGEGWRIFAVGLDGCLGEGVTAWGEHPSDALRHFNVALWRRDWEHRDAARKRRVEAARAAGVPWYKRLGL